MFLENDPSDDIYELIYKKRISTFEFACLFTEVPQNCLKINLLHDQDLDKQFWIVPAENFTLENCSKSFQKMLHQLNEDIDFERVQGKICRICPGIHFSIAPFDALVWSLKKKYPWPKELQQALSIIPKRQNKLKSWRKMIENMIVAQYIILIRKEIIPSDIIKDPLMQSYIPKAKAKKPNRQLQNNIAMVGKVREPGWQQEPQDTITDLLKVIPEVLEHFKSHSECDFVLLRDVIITSVFIKIQDIEGIEKVCRMSLSDFKTLMLQDELINLYVMNSPPFIGYFIKETIKEFYEQILDIFPMEEWSFSEEPKSECI